MPRTNKTTQNGKLNLKNILFYLMAAIASLVEQDTFTRVKKKIINSFIILGAIIYGTKYMMSLDVISLEHMQNV